METFGKTLFISLLTLVIGLSSFAEQEYATINGNFAEKATAEIVIVQKNAGKSTVLVHCFKDSMQDCFTMRFPVMADAEYVMKVLLYKPGSRRMELDNTLSYPIQPLAGGVQVFSIKPSVFDQEKLTGVSLAKNAKVFSTLTLTGTFKHFRFAGPLTVSKVVDGQMLPVQSVTLEADKPDFYFHVPIATEGFYYLGNLGWRKRIYAKPGDSLELIIDGDNHELQWTNTTKENDLLTQWQLLIEPITIWGYERAGVNVSKLNLDSFTKTYQQLQTTIRNFMMLASGPNATFNRLLKTAITVDNQFAPLRLLSLLSAKNEKDVFATPAAFNTIPAYYKEALLRNPVTTMRIMQLGEGRDYLDLLTKFSLVTVDENKRANLTTAERLQIMIKAIPNDTLRAVFLNDQLKQIAVTNLREFKEVFAPLQKYATTPEVKKRYKNVYAQFSSDTLFIGKSAWNFSLPDTTGKLVSMKAFKGKVVLIDMWATSCGPCKADFPFLREIEDAYRDSTNLVVVGISTDNLEKRESWLEMVRNEKLGGVQLLDDEGKSFAQKYRITAVPRFLLIDKKGRWFEIRCPRSSDNNGETLKKYLDEALAAK